MQGCGLDLLVTANDKQSGVAFETNGGILMSSTQEGSIGIFAAENVGNSTVISAPDPLIRNTGDFLTGQQAVWVPEPVNAPDGIQFIDPTLGRPDPPLTADSLPLRNYAGGGIVGSTDPNNPLVVTSGIHFPTEVSQIGENATGEPLLISGNVRLMPGAGRIFGEFIFPGGVEIGNNSTVTIGPGRYLFAGRKLGNQGRPQALLTLGSNSVITDGLPAGSPPIHPGELLIFGGADYPGMGAAILRAAGVSDFGLLNQLFAMTYGTTGITAKSQPGVEIVLHGLNASVVGLPEELGGYADFLIWQERSNSVYLYGDDLGNYNEAGCDGPVPTSGCLRGIDGAFSEMHIEANTTNLFGIIYGPRGGFLTIGRGNHHIRGAIISGAMHVARGATLKLD